MWRPVFGTSCSRPASSSSTREHVIVLSLFHRRHTHRAAAFLTSAHPSTHPSASERGGLYRFKMFLTTRSALSRRVPDTRHGRLYRQHYHHHQKQPHGNTTYETGSCCTVVCVYVACLPYVLAAEKKPHCVERPPLSLATQSPTSACACPGHRPHPHAVGLARPRSRPGGKAGARPAMSHRLHGVRARGERNRISRIRADWGCMQNALGAVRLEEILCAESVIEILKYLQSLTYFCNSL